MPDKTIGKTEYCPECGNKIAKLLDGYDAREEKPPTMIWCSPKQQPTRLDKLETLVLAMAEYLNDISTVHTAYSVDGYTESSELFEDYNIGLVETALKELKEHKDG